jgi:CRP-like cAMP-binding protein/di/tricarboxylate transporter
MSSPENPGRLAAMSLSRSPLLSQLGRVDLARLAGELEEQHFRPGDVIVREGDPGDSFYVIKSGEAGVTVGAETFDALLRPGECFGEMALLGDTPRTASVVARTEVTVWRLSRERFDAIVTRERAIARSIERTLTQRLALTSRELSAMRGAAHRLARSALGLLSPGALALLRVLVVRRVWDAEVVAAIAARIGQGDALAELDRIPGFVLRTGRLVAVDEATIGLIDDELGPADATDLDAAVEALARAGDAIGAVEVALHRGPARALALLAAEEAQLIDTASVEDVDRWIAGAADPALAAGCAALRRRIAARRRADSGPGVAAGTGPPLSGVRRWLNVRRPTAVAATALAIVVFVLGCTLPVPEGLGRAGLVTLAALVATVPLLVADVLPDYVVVLLLATVLVVPGLVTPADILGGFATPAWLMIFTLLVVGAAVARSGLMLRLVLASLERLPGNFATQSLVLSGTGLVLTAGITSGATRIALGVPIARALAESLGFGRHSGGAAAIGLLTFFTFIQLDTLFLTGSFTALVVHDLLPDAVRAQVTWWRWFLLALPPVLIMFGLYYAFLVAHFRPRSRRAVDVRAVRLQEELLGRLTRAEIWSVVVLVALVVGFATRPYHGVAPAWLAVAVFVVLFVVGVLDHTALHTGGSLGMLVYSGVILSLGTVFTSLGIDTWLSSLVRGGMPAMVTSPYGFVLVLALTAFALRFFVPWMTLSTLLALVAIPMAEGLGFQPFIPVLVVLIAGDHAFLPYVNTGYAMVYFASDGELYRHEQARTPLMVESAIRVGALVASVPIWRLLGVL